MLYSVHKQQHHARAVVLHPTLLCYLMQIYQHTAVRTEEHQERCSSRINKKRYHLISCSALLWFIYLFFKRQFINILKAFNTSIIKSTDVSQCFTDSSDCASGRRTLETDVSLPGMCEPLLCGRSPEGDLQGWHPCFINFKPYYGQEETCWGEVLQNPVNRVGGERKKGPGFHETSGFKQTHL